jgi:hypothetical protein
MIKKECSNNGRDVSDAICVMMLQAGQVIGAPSTCGTRIRGPGPLGWGSLKFQAVKYGIGSRGTRILQ